MPLTEIIEQFQWADSELRLEMLLDYARKLPPLPERFIAQRDAGVNRVPECQTPVFLFMELHDGKLKIHVDVADESPTVQGFISILVHAFNEVDPQEVADAPNDLLDQLGLSDVVRMQRAVGLAAILARIKRNAAEAREFSR
jgi:cysteine desulfuration protein SufE